MAGGGRGWLRGRCLGYGSTASVYLAAATTSEGQNLFAVKSAEFNLSAPLQREQRILSSLCSPHVVSCFGSHVGAEPDGRVLYNLFMEYLPGGSLAGAIRRQGRGLDERTIRLYTRGILNGLEYLHGRGVVHCDVKGQNILLGEDHTTVKLADLGCARRIDGGGEDRRVTSGTPRYMAPEVARGEQQGPEGDIWALGCTVIEMATGRPPWRDVADPVAAIHQIAFSEELPEIPGNIVSDAAKDFIGRCLSRDPRKRWSAEELLGHPFVDCGEDSAPCVDPASKRISPKSTLDQVFWDSWTEEEEEEEQCEPEARMSRPELDSAPERLRQLVGPSPAANTAQDDGCWVTVRSGLRGPSWEASSGELFEASTAADGPAAGARVPTESAAAAAGVGGAGTAGDGDRQVEGYGRPSTAHSGHQVVGYCMFGPILGRREGAVWT